MTSDNSNSPMFSGAELALADAMILMIKVMAMRGVIDAEAIDAVFSDMEDRYRGANLASAAAMAEYLRVNVIGGDDDMTALRGLPTPRDAPEGSA